MGLFGGLFKSKEEKERERKEKDAKELQAAKRDWEAGKAEKSYDKMRGALGPIGRLAPSEYPEATQLMLEMFPDQAGTIENDTGVHYYFQSDYEKAIEHYYKSYKIDGPGSCARDNILEACQKLAEDAEDPKVAVKHLLRYFALCTGKVDPSARVEEISLVGLFTDTSRSQAEVHKETAEKALSDIRDRLEDVEDKAFVQDTQKTLKEIEKEYGLESEA